MDLFFDVMGIVVPFVIAGGLIYLVIKRGVKLF